MCCENHIISLIESSDCHISYCRMCKSFCIAYKNCCASFSPRELIQFTSILEDLEIEDYQYELFGEDMAIVKSPHASIGFCLSPDDVEAVLASINQAKTLLEVFQIVYN